MPGWVRQGELWVVGVPATVPTPRGVPVLPVLCIFCPAQGKSAPTPGPAAAPHTGSFYSENFNGPAGRCWGSRNPELWSLCSHYTLEGCWGLQHLSRRAAPLCLGVNLMGSGCFQDRQSRASSLWPCTW